MLVFLQLHMYIDKKKYKLFKLLCQTRNIMSWLWYNGQKLFKPVKNTIYNKEIEQMIFLIKALHFRCVWSQKWRNVASTSGAHSVDRSGVIQICHRCLV